MATHLKNAAVELHIFGGFDSEIVALQHRAAQEGLAEVLYFKAFVEPKVLHEILDSEISIGLVPLQDTFYNRYLTCPVKVLDFMSHGLPIVASDLPSIRDILRENGFYCDSQNAAEFAANLLYLLEDAETYRCATEKVYKRAQELQWQCRAQQILKFADEKSIGS